MTENVAELARAAREAEEADERIERGEQARPPAHRVRAPREPAQVYSLRMPVDKLEQLRQAAEQAGVSPSTLMRTWVLERLDADNPAVIELLRSLVRDEVSREVARRGRPQRRQRTAVG